MQQVAEIQLKFTASLGLLCESTLIRKEWDTMKWNKGIWMGLDDSEYLNLQVH